MHIVYADETIVVCVKPAGVLSTDSPGGLPELLRQELGTDNFRTVHRLDQVVGGLMVLARRARAASDLSRQIRDGQFEKEYLAVVHGHPQSPEGTLTDLLLRDKATRTTRVVTEAGKDVQPASLSYRVVNQNETMTRVRIRLHTGRTHQIRVQFSSRGMPLVGERKYSEKEDGCDIALWSCRLAFLHPKTQQPMEFYLEPPAVYPWTEV